METRTKCTGESSFCVRSVVLPAITYVFFGAVDTPGCMGVLFIFKYGVQR
jgi:hypothetical protein